MSHVHQFHAPICCTLFLMAEMRRRSIVMLESNAGYLQLHELLQSAGSRDMVCCRLALCLQRRGHCPAHNCARSGNPRLRPCKCDVALSLRLII